MRRNGLKFLIGAIVIVLALMTLNRFALGRLRTVYAPFAVERAQWFDALGQLHEFFAYAKQWRNLTEENQILKEQIQRHQSSPAALEALRYDTDLLRRALALKPLARSNPIPAGIFNISMTPDGYAALINQGKEAGIRPGAIAVSPEGVLIGVVAEVFGNSSHLTLVSDPSFKATVRVLGGQTSGIVRGALVDGMVVDLIVQSDRISEGDTLVSSGNDMIPSGLVLGTVSHVEANDTELFKKVKVKPAAEFINSRVLIINL